MSTMLLSDNSRLLVASLESTEELDGRYRNIRLVNVDPVSGQKHGAFSLVFCAYDRLEGENVALKFFDIDPENQRDRYRLDAFRREHSILQTLISKERCLQLASKLSKYDLRIPISPTQNVTISTEYFALQWLEHGLDHFFLGKKIHSALDKLRLFNDIVLAVEALHRYEVFHRDIKPGNLRSANQAVKRLVVAIDLGVAAQYSSTKVRPEYECSVGQPTYASPEAFCGLAGNRKLAPYTDIYALGCLLFELFNLDLYVTALVSANGRYTALLAGMQTYLTKANDDASRLAAWQHGLDMHASGAPIIEIDGPGSDVPSGIAPMLNELLRGMAHFDYRQRVTRLEKVRSRIWSCIRCLENEAMYVARVKRVKTAREMRLKKLMQDPRGMQRISWSPK